MERNPKYPGYDSRDTGWDEFHKKRGQMTNAEFFTSNGPGGFYEGMEWDGDEWVPDAASRRRAYEAEKREQTCSECGACEENCYCG
jgi:hypothetical protein